MFWFCLVVCAALFLPLPFLSFAHHAVLHDSFFMSTPWLVWPLYSLSWDPALSAGTLPYDTLSVLVPFKGLNPNRPQFPCTMKRKLHHRPKVIAMTWGRPLVVQQVCDDCRGLWTSLRERILAHITSKLEARRLAKRRDICRNNQNLQQQKQETRIPMLIAKGVPLA